MGFKKNRAFNIAMLAKQSWKLQTYSNSLVCKICKAQYYHNGSFVTALIGSNPSYILQSLMAAQDLVRNYGRWRVGSGSKIQIWQDLWLQDELNPNIESTPQQYQQIFTITDLRMPHQPRWNEKLPIENFNDRDVLQILSIPFSVNRTHDRWIW